MDDGKGRDAKILNDITQYFKISLSGKSTMQCMMEGARCCIKTSITKDIPKYYYQQGRIQQMMEGGEMQCDQLQSLPLFTQSSLRTKYNDIHIHSNIPKYTQIYSNTLRYTQIHSNILKYTQIYSNTLKYIQILSNILKYTKYTQIHSIY